MALPTFKGQADILIQEVMGSKRRGHRRDATVFAEFFKNTFTARPVSPYLPTIGYM
jgi:hypothetical protein